MRVREVVLGGIRGLGPVRRASFLDPLTGQVRPLTVVAGSNGSGKTTLFETIYGLLSYALDTVEDTPIVAEIRNGAGIGAVRLEWPGSPTTPSKRPEWIALGQRDQAPEEVSRATRMICDLRTGGRNRALTFGRTELNQWVGGMLRDPATLRDGLILFPHNRWVEHSQRGAIEPPSSAPSWLWRFQPKEAWQGSLAQLWVWQNYLDLEQGSAGRANLLSFVDQVETVLGQGRRVRIAQGHVTIERPGGPAVEPHQLPSGEQQVLTLFGELARRLRPGALVLVDEVEISLHPALQRKVIEVLRTLAAKYDLQIVVTTHSTEILRAVEPSEVLSLDDLSA
jgi:energy-coupling factor transporter ATP-binding protein EcfA2